MSIHKCMKLKLYLFQERIHRKKNIKGSCQGANSSSGYAGSRSVSFQASESRLPREDKADKVDKDRDRLDEGIGSDWAVG